MRTPPLACLALLAAVLCPSPLAEPAHAQAATDERTAFDIPAQPLDAALAQYFRITGVQLLYDSALTHGRRSSALHGNYAPREALRILLAGTGLIVRYSRANAAVIIASNSEAQGPLVPLGRVVVRENETVRLTPADRLGYYSQLEDELQSLLREDKRTAHLAFNLTVELSIGDDSRVAGLKLGRGTGRRSTDAALVAVLQGAPATRPPPGLVQPLAIRLTGRPR